MELAFAHLNLLRNPFGELTEEERAAVAVVEIDPEVEWLRTTRRTLQIIGDSGRGKTTHLIAFRARFPDVPLVRIRPGERARVPGEATPLLIIDEVQLLSPRARRRLWGRNASFVVGTHKDLEPELRRAGVDVRTLRPAEHMTAGRLTRLLTLRIEAARRGPGPVPGIGIEVAPELLNRFGSDVRAAEDLLYDRFQTLAEVTDVQV
jgi:hypothetical protein